ncbi:hypothetical protein Leryth_020706, partial [Lithospermum erythrorhizon]
MYNISFLLYSLYTNIIGIKASLLNMTTKNNVVTFQYPR